MMLVEGEAAVRLGQLARERWRHAHGWKIKPPTDIEHSPWPESVSSGLDHVRVAIARTEPAYRGREAVEEVSRLYLDAIAAARKTIYIENQYFTAWALADALITRLAEKDGPQVVLVLPEKTGGWLEQVIMDVVRGRIVRRLHEADRHDRLRIYFPYQPGLGDDCISVHSKLLIIDDRLLRIGSSNTSNRSMGLDTECDLAIESSKPKDKVARYIRRIRAYLLAEHLGCEAEDVIQTTHAQGGLIETIECLQGDQRSLRPLDCEVAAEVDELVPDTSLIDPSEPFSPDYFVEEYVPKSRKPQGRRRLMLFAAVVLVLFGLAATWRWGPLHSLLSPEQIGQYLASISSIEGRAVVTIGGFIIASLLMVPVTLLAIIGGLVFGGWEAFLYVMTGAMTASALGFLGGRYLGKGVIERMSGSSIEKLSKRLAERGTVAVALLRLVPVAPFAVFNLVAGSSYLGARQFLVGSLLGLMPGLGAITLFSSSLSDALRAPSWISIAFVIGLGTLLVGAAWLVKRWLRTNGKLRGYLRL